jgi:MoaA/NifB/PqqE/SkfB family radical SAM enzyme
LKKILSISSLQKGLERPAMALAYAKGKLKAGTGYRFGLGYSLPPGRVFFVLTGRCNLMCEMCPQQKHPGFREEIMQTPEMKPERLRDIVDQIKGFRPLVFVSGGELFLHSGWLDFLACLKNAGLFCSIGTNGTFLKEYASELLQLGIDEVSVSIDGLEATHDAIRRVDGTWARAVGGIQKLLSLRSGAGGSIPRVTVIFTITGRNCMEIEEMAAAMTELGVDNFRIGHLNFLRPDDFVTHMNITRKLFGVDKDTSWEGYAGPAPNIDAGAVAGTLQRLKSNRNGRMRVSVFPDFTAAEMIEYYSNKPFRAGSFKTGCLVPWEYAVIGPGGELILCPNYVVGNLCNESFVKLWNSPRARSFRRLIARKKELPACSRGCCFYYT